MTKKTLILTKTSLLLSGVFACSFASAETEDKATLRFSHHVLSYTQDSNKVTPDGQKAVTTKTNTVAGFVGQWEIMAQYGKVVFYAYPDQANIPLGIGYVFNDNLEVDLLVGTTSATTSPETTNTTQAEYGFNVTWTQPVANNSIEAYLNPVYGSSKTDTKANATTGTAASKSNITQSNITLGVDYIWQFSKNFHSVHGISVSMIDTTESEKPAKGKQADTQFNIRLAGFRYFL